MSGEDERHMTRALALAARGGRAVRPNPLVGCVLVRDGQVVGEGWHERVGGPHAEIAALAAAGPAARGATAYVTLEPCAHTGRTPPCVDALAEAGVRRVVVALADPNPVATGGEAALRAAGIAVEFGVLADQAARQNRVFLHDVASARPFVVVKAAVSLDGRIAAADGTSRWITGHEARRAAHLLRADADAVLVGSGTALADDPRLTVRLGDGHDTGPPPLRVLLDGRARVRGGHLLDGSVPTLVATLGAHPAEDRPGIEVLRLPAGADGHLDLRAVLAALYQRGVRVLLVEGGAEVAGSLVAAGLVDELVVHIAPLLLGGSGRALLEGDGITTLAAAPRFQTLSVRRAGDDTLVTLAPAA